MKESLTFTHGLIAASSTKGERMTITYHIQRRVRDYHHSPALRGEWSEWERLPDGTYLRGINLGAEMYDQDHAKSVLNICRSDIQISSRWQREYRLIKRKTIDAVVD